jgi:signal transduction histidine kinase
MSEGNLKGRLMVKTEALGDAIRITFADDGPGIKEDELARVFDPFYTTKEVGKGTGLGLSISYGIVQDHGGQIYVESEAGNGASFIVELPLQSADEATADPPPSVSGTATFPRTTTPRAEVSHG